MQDIQINNDQINVTLRESLLSLFQDKVVKKMEELDCSYFTHNLIKNCYKPGHTVSSFYSNPEWQQEYWQKYWNADPLADKVCEAAETDGFAISSWDIAPDNEVMKRRKLVCSLYDGVQFTFKHEDGTLENYAFGWKESGRGKMGFARLLKLSGMVDDFRDAHFKLFSGSIPHSSTGTQ
jgi:hypothetical protein